MVGSMQRGEERLPGRRRRLEQRQIPKAISRRAVAGGSRASIGSSSPQTNLLAGSLSILTHQSIQAHPLNDVRPAQGRDTLHGPVDGVRLRRAGPLCLFDFCGTRWGFFFYLNKNEYEAVQKPPCALSGGLAQTILIIDYF